MSDTKKSEQKINKITRKLLGYLSYQDYSENNYPGLYRCAKFNDVSKYFKENNYTTIKKYWENFPFIPELVGFMLIEKLISQEKITELRKLFMTKFIYDLLCISTSLQLSENFSTLNSKNLLVGHDLETPHKMCNRLEELVSKSPSGRTQKGANIAQRNYEYLQKLAFLNFDAGKLLESKTNLEFFQTYFALNEDISVKRSQIDSSYQDKTESIFRNTVKYSDVRDGLDDFVANLDFQIRPYYKIIDCCDNHPIRKIFLFSPIEKRDENKVYRLFPNALLSEEGHNYQEFLID